MIRVPGILAGLKERSQSAYAAPAPNPVDSAMGHVRPTGNVLFSIYCCCAEGCKTQTAE